MSSPVSKFDECLRRMRTLSRASQLDIHSSEPPRYSHGYLLMVLPVVLGPFLISLMVFEQEYDFSTLCLVIGYGLILLQGAIRSLFVQDARSLAGLADIFRGIYDSNSLADSKYRDMCMKFAVYAMLLMNFGIVAYYLGVGFMFIDSLQCFAIEGILPPMIGVHLPKYIEQLPGMYALVLVWNVVAPVNCIIFILQVDLFIFIIIVSILMVSEIIVGQINELNVAIKNSKRGRNTKELRKRFVQIIEMQIALNR